MALAVAVIAAGAAASATVPGEGVLCTYAGMGEVVEMSCGDPETEAALAARMLSPGQARAAGCTPVVVGEDRRVMATPSPMIQHSDEPAPAPTPRTPDPALASRVGRAWDRIERWLGAHASVTLRKLRHPVDAARITGWEEDNGRLPDDLYASLLRHDGADDGALLFPGYAPVDLMTAESLRWGNCHTLVIEGSMAEADPERGTWHGSLVPFASDTRGRELFVNPRTGRVGEKAWNERVRYDGPMGWPSYVALLEAVAGSLQSGQALRGRYPAVTPGCELTWQDEPAPAPPPATCAGPPRPSPTPTPTETAEPSPSPLSPKDAREIGCKPARRPPVVKYPDKAVAAQVDAAWRRIERWLARHAPRTLRSLRPPASPSAIARAEARMGLTFPDDLRASLLRHDGGRFGPGGLWDYAPVREIAREWAMMCGLYLDGSIAPDPWWWHGRLIPYAMAVDGGHLFVDAQTGKTGEYFNEEGLRLDGDVAWPSYLAQLAAVADALESGRPLRRWKPVVARGELDWDLD